MKLSRNILGAVVLLLLLSACGKVAVPAKSSASPSTSATSNPYGSGFRVSPPADTDIVLTISGSKTINFTMKELRDRASKSITIQEPFVKVKQTFGVVSFKSLFSGILISDRANLNTIALNDYAFKASAKEFFDNNAYIAISRNGSAIPMDSGGPIRIIFDTPSKWFTNVDAWNWSLRTVEVI